MHTNNSDSAQRKRRFTPGTGISAAFFAAAATVFILFILLHPLDWQQPETLRLHYYGLQSGLTDGPLSAGLSVNDLRKPLAWRAQGGMFDGRYPIMLLDALVPKLYQLVYPLTGPFLGEPVNVVLILVTAVMLVACVTVWSGSRAAGWMSAGFWLVTSQTLLDSRYPIRPNMTLVSLLLVYLLWEIGRTRSSRPGPAFSLRLTLVLSLAIFSHEFALLFGPAMILLILLLGRSWRRTLPPALLVTFLSWGLYLAVLFFLLPPLARRVIGERPSMDWMTGGVQPILQDPALLFVRFRDYALVGFRELARQSLGWGIFLPFWAKVAAALGLLLFLLSMRREGWRRSLPFWIVSAAFFLGIALLMFPVIPPSVEMPAYYYAPIVALFIMPLGMLLSGLDPLSDKRRWAAAAAALLTIGGANALQAHAVMEGMPGDFGFNPRMREYVRDILSAGGKVREESSFGPVYAAYPRPRAFDISQRWDIMLRVWHGEAEQVFSMMMPVLHLGLYESRALLGSPDEFAALAGVDPERYEASARVYWDLPARRRYLLSDLAAAAPPFAGWKRETGEAVAPAFIPARFAGSLLGPRPRTLLPAGTWVSEIPSPSSGLTSPAAIALMIRADLMPPGPDDVVNRTEPLPFRRCRVRLRERATGKTVWDAEQTYGWSWQLLMGKVPPTPPGGWDVVVESTAEAEVVGPLLVDSGKTMNPDRSRR